MGLPQTKPDYTLDDYLAQERPAAVHSLRIGFSDVYGRVEFLPNDA